MQNKQQMLASSRARATYAKLQQQRVSSTVCRGASGDDFNFFYSDLSYWSDNCLGWVLDDLKKSKICPFCAAVSPSEIEFQVKIASNEIRKEFRDINRISGQPAEPSKPGTPKLRQLHKGRKRGSDCDKGVPSAKNKKNKKGYVQKGKNSKK
jgi:hypothetical protein